MSAPAIAPINRAAIHRAAVNKANAQHSTGPRTDAGKQRSSLNALRHGLTAKSAVLPSEDAAAYEQHRRQFLDEYQPATPTETQLVTELIDTSWRLNRIPLLEADLLHRAANPPNEQAAIDFDIVDAHRLIANLTIQSQRLSRQFQKTLQTLNELQTKRRERRQDELKEAAALLELNNHKGLPFDPTEHGFVFSKEEIERHAQLLARRRVARHIAYIKFEMCPTPQEMSVLVGRAENQRSSAATH